MDKPTFYSETFTLTIQNLIGVHFGKVEWERKNAKFPDDVNNQCRKMWAAVTHMSRVVSTMDDCTFLNVVMGNEKCKVAEYIKEVTGCNPWFDDDNALYDYLNYGLKVK